NPNDPATIFGPFVMDAARPDRLLMGTNIVYETTDRGGTWAPISFPGENGWNDSASLVALATAPTDAATVYASTWNSHLFVTTNDGVTWARRDPAAPWLDYSSILVDPRDSRTAYVTSINYRMFTGVGHVWRTRDGGATWEDISGNLPDLPALALALDTRFSADVLFVGLQDGVYVSSDQGASWARLGRGLPNASVPSLAFDPDQGLLPPGTSGPGVA